jgi:chemotaxis response regulator CheB
MKNKVLIIENSSFKTEIIKNTLKKQNYKIVGSTTDAKSAIKIALEVQPDYICIDNLISDLTDFQLLKTLQDTFLNIKIILFEDVFKEGAIKEKHKSPLIETSILN